MAIINSLAPFTLRHVLAVYMAGFVNKTNVKPVLPFVPHPVVSFQVFRFGGLAAPFAESWFHKFAGIYRIFGGSSSFFLVLIASSVSNLIFRILGTSSGGLLILSGSFSVFAFMFSIILLVILFPLFGLTILVLGLTCGFTSTWILHPVFRSSSAASSAIRMMTIRARGVFVELVDRLQLSIKGAICVHTNLIFHTISPDNCGACVYHYYNAAAR